MGGEGGWQGSASPASHIPVGGQLSGRREQGLPPQAWQPPGEKGFQPQTHPRNEVGSRGGLAGQQMRFAMPRRAHGARPRVAERMPRYTNSARPARERCTTGRGVPE